MKKSIISLSLIIIFVFLGFKSVDFNKLLETLKLFHINYLILLFLFAIGVHLIKAYRYYIVNKTLNIHTSYIDILKAFTAAQALSIFPAGDALKPIIYSKEENISGKKAVIPFINQAFFELLIPASVTIIGSFFYNEIRNIGILTAILLVIIIFLMLNRKFIDILFQFLKFNKIKNIAVFIQDNLQKTIIKPNKTFPRKTFFIEIGLTVATTALNGALLYLIAKELNINLNIILAIFIFSAGSVISGIATITPGGSGFTEGGMVGLFLLSKVADYQTSFTTVLLFRFLTFLLFLIIGLITLLIFYKALVFKK